MDSKSGTAKVSGFVPAPSIIALVMAILWREIASIRTILFESINPRGFPMMKSKFTSEQMAAVLRQAQGDVPVARVCCEHDISIATFYKWRRDFRNKMARLGTECQSTMVAEPRPDQQAAQAQLIAKHDDHQSLETAHSVEVNEAKRA